MRLQNRKRVTILSTRAGNWNNTSFPFRVSRRRWRIMPSPIAHGWSTHWRSLLQALNGTVLWSWAVTCNCRQRYGNILGTAKFAGHIMAPWDGRMNGLLHPRAEKRFRVLWTYSTLRRTAFPTPMLVSRRFYVVR